MFNTFCTSGKTLNGSEWYAGVLLSLTPPSPANLLIIITHGYYAVVVAAGGSSHLTCALLSIHNIWFLWLVYVVLCDSLTFRVFLRPIPGLFEIFSFSFSSTGDQPLSPLPPLKTNRLPSPHVRFRCGNRRLVAFPAFLLLLFRIRGIDAGR